MPRLSPILPDAVQACAAARHRHSPAPAPRCLSACRCTLPFSCCNLSLPTDSPPPALILSPQSKLFCSLRNRSSGSAPDPCSLVRSSRSTVAHFSAPNSCFEVFTSKRFGFLKLPFSRCNQLLISKNCSMDRELDVRSSTLIDDVELEEPKPSISTMIMNFETKFDPYDAVSTPLYQTATFKQPSATENGPYDYTRSGNPTRDALESLLAKLEKADRAFCFTSGMAALAAVAQLVGTGEEIVAGDDLYGGSDRLLSQVIPKRGIVVKRVNTSDLDEVSSAIGPLTKLVWLESPTNPRLQISDIRTIWIKDFTSLMAEISN